MMDLMWNRITALSAIYLMLVALPTIGADITELDSVQYLQKSAEPAEGAQTIRLEELWRIDVDDEEQLIGVVSGVVGGPGGTVWIADQQLGQVVVFSANGEFLRTVSGIGDGPGEVRWPHDLMWLPDGNLGITDSKLGMITTLDANGFPNSPIRSRTRTEIC